MKKHQDKSRTGLNRVEDQTTPTQENTRGESHASSWFDGHGVYLWKTPGVATAGEEHRPGTDSMSQHLTVPLIWWWEEQKSLESLFAACAPNPILSLGDGNKAESKRHPKSERERGFRCAWAVAAPSKLIRLKCANHHQTTIRVNTHLKRSNSAVLSGKIPIKPLENRIDKAVRSVQHSTNFTAQSMKLNYYYKPSLNL